MRRIAALGAALAVALALAGCGDPLAVGSSFGTGTDCPVGAHEDADGPVEITMWHAMPRENQATLDELTDEFNASQDEVRVRTVFQGNYDETLTKYRASAQGGARPDIVQAEDSALQTMIDSGTILPVQACVDEDDYSLDDYLPRAIAYYSVQRTLYPLPFNVSNPVLYYNKTVFREAGLDPDDPPANFAEMREASQAIVDSGATNVAVAFKLDPWYLEQWLATDGDLYVDNENGRTERATEVRFDNEQGLEVFEWLEGMVDDGLASFVGTDTSVFDNLLAIGNRNAAMTIDTTAALGTISAVLGSGQFAGVELGVGALPGYQSDEGGVTVGGAGLYLVNSGDDEKMAAAWEFLKFLNTPKSQTTWSLGTGYIPVRASAVEGPEIQKQWQEEPGYRVAYDQLLRGPTNFATAGSVVGNFQAVRDAVAGGYERLLTTGASPQAALDAAADGANDALESYNDRIGV